MEGHIFRQKRSLGYVTHRHNFEMSKCTGFQTKDGKIVNLVPFMPDEDKTFSGSLVLDLRI